MRTVAVDELVEDACGQAHAIRSRQVSARELVQAYLERIERLDGVLRAYVSVDPDGALATADAMDEGRGGGPFGGVAVSVKDVEDVAGLPTTHSCEALASHVAADDGPVARRLRAGGFAFLGKSNIPEFCSDMTVSKLNGATRNPWDLALTPGGSSGGAAAAVAGGLCAVAHGTDGAGSIRVPAAWCGLVGLKPSRGLVAFGPDEGPSYFGTSVHGVLSRSVRDAAAFLDLLAPVGPLGTWTPHRDRPFADEMPEQDGARLRIGVSATLPVGTVHPDCAAAAEDVATLLAELGHHVDVVAPAWEQILAVASGPMSVPGPAALVSESDFDRVEPRNRATVQYLASITVLEHHTWVEAVRRATRRFCELWSGIDVLVTPTAGMLPPPVTWAQWDDDVATHRARFATFPNFAHPFNLTGQPAITLPLGWSAAGLPIGVQLAGRSLGEATLLRLAAELERARPWAGRIAGPARELDGAYPEQTSFS